MKEVEATADMVDVLYAFEQCSQAHQPHRAQAAHGIQLKHTYNTVSHHCFSFRLAQAPLDSHLKCGHSMISLLSRDHQTILNITLLSTLLTQKYHAQVKKYSLFLITINSYCMCPSAIIVT